MLPENELIVKPLTDFMTYKYGWKIKKIHGSQFQSGLPDLYCMHHNYEPKWVECKVIRNGDFSFTPDQLVEFPAMIAHNVKIWLVAGDDFRGAKNLPKLQRAYDSLFKPHNLAFYLDPASRRTLLR